MLGRTGLQRFGRIGNTVSIYRSIHFLSLDTIFLSMSTKILRRARVCVCVWNDESQNTINSIQFKCWLSLFRLFLLHQMDNKIHKYRHTLEVALTFISPARVLLFRHIHESVYSINVFSRAECTEMKYNGYQTPGPEWLNLTFSLLMRNRLWIGF